MKEFSVAMYDLIQQVAMSPVELMWVYLDGDTTPTHRFCLDTSYVHFGGYVHTPLSFRRGRVSTSSKKVLDKMEIRIDNVSGWFNEIVTQRPVDGSRLRITRVFRETWADSEEFIVIFDGRIQSMSFDGQNASVEVVSHLSFLSKPCPGRTFAPSCPHRLGSERCGVDLTDEAFTLSGLTGSSGSGDLKFVSAALTQEDNYWAHGYVEIIDGDYKGLQRPIGSSSEGNTAVYLRYPFPVSLEGLTVKIVIGCRKTKGVCEDVFANLLNFGGFAEVPRRPLIPVPM